MEEIWKTLRGYEGLYEISNLGNVKSIRERGNSKDDYILKQSKSKCGYRMVHLTKNNKSKNISVHRLVATTFIENKYNKRDVNHIDGNKENNTVDNLEWTTHKENMEHARKNNLISITDKVIEHGTRTGKKFGKTNGIKRRKKVKQYSTDMKLIDEYESMTQAHKATGVSISDISKCCNNKKRFAGGCIWKFLN